MNPNIGSLDRALRIALGLVIIGLGVYFQSLWGVAGFLPLFTGLFRFCPAYRLLDVSTCKIPTK